MKTDKKKIVFVVKPNALTKVELLNIKGGTQIPVADCICKCGTNTASMQKSENIQAQ